MADSGAWPLQAIAIANSCAKLLKLPHGQGSVTQQEQPSRGRGGLTKSHSARDGFPVSEKASSLEKTERGAKASLSVLRIEPFDGGILRKQGYLG